MSKLFANKTVLITGADGFIGSHLVEKLIEHGAKVRALIYYNSWNSCGWLHDVKFAKNDQLDLFVGDVRDSERSFQSMRIDHDLGRALA